MKQADTNTTTIKVFETDRDWLLRLFGSPTHLAFHKVTELCPHLEKVDGHWNRTYTTALVRTDGARALNAGTQNTTEISGFYCRTCKRYVFPDPRANAS